MILYKLKEKYSKIKLIYNSFLFVLILVFFSALFSCKDQKEENTSEMKKDFASQILYNAKIVQRDSGKVSMRINAPIIEKYEYVDTPYVETKKGLYIEIIDKANPNNPSKLWANYAKMIEKKEFYEAKGDVKIINPEGQTFKMQTLYWDKKKGRMHTKDTVYITDKEGNTLIGSGGMNAKDDFSEYSLYNSFGEMNANNISEKK